MTVEVTLKKDNHTEWVKETQGDGSVKRVAKIFNKGDRVIVSNETYEAFKDRMETVGPAVTPPPLVSRSTSLAQELASLPVTEMIAILTEAGLTGSLSDLIDLIPPEGDKNPNLVETKAPAEKTEAKPPAEKVGAKRPAKKIGAKK